MSDLTAKEDEENLHVSSRSKGGVLLSDSTASDNNKRRRLPKRRTLCLAAVGCCCVISLVAGALLVLLFVGIINPLRNDLDAQVCRVRMCSELPQGSCPASDSAVGATLNLLIDTRVYVCHTGLEPQASRQGPRQVVLCYSEV